MSSEQIDDVFKCSDFDYSDGVVMNEIYSSYTLPRLLGRARQTYHQLQ
jgi:hypothetical protein